MASTMNPETTARVGARAAEAPVKAKRSPVLPILAIVALGAIGWGVKNYIYGRSHETTDNAQVDGSIVPVLAKVGGFVKSIAVVENQPVKAGQVIVEIDDSEYAVRLTQADAELSAAAAAAGGRGIDGQAEALIRSAESQRQVVDAQILSARAVSKQQLDAAQAAFDQANANLVAAERQANSATAQLSNAEAGSKFAQARLAGAKATRDNAALQLSYTKVVAPLTGTVSRKQIEVGQLVAPGQPLLTLVADTSVWINANFKETQLADIRVGQPVELEVDSYPGCVAEGKVESLSAATGAKFALLPPDNSTGNFTKVVQRLPVRIQVTKGCGADRPMRPGMSVTAAVKTK